MNILITGCTGFIGSNILNKFQKNNKIYIILRNKKDNKKFKYKNIKIINYKNYDELNKKISKIKVESIIHTATHYAKTHNQKDLKEFSNSNILFGNIILENIEKMNVSKFINFTTVWENYNGKKNSPHNLYAFYKKTYSELIKFYEKKYKNTNFYNLIIADTFGANDKRKKLITVIRKNYKGNKISKITSSRLNINLLNVKDIVKAVKIILSRKINPSTYNLSNNTYNIKKLIDHFNLKNKKKIRVKFLSNKLINEKVYKFKNLPNWRPMYTSINEICKVIKL